MDRDDVGMSIISWSTVRYLLHALQGDLAVHGHLLRRIDDAHAADADLLDEMIVGPGAGRLIDWDDLAPRATEHLANRIHCLPRLANG